MQMIQLGRACPLAGAGLLVASVLFANTGIAGAADIDLPRLPAASPDGSWVSFTWRGDLWKAPAAGGSAIRLTSHPADESRSVWSNDGKLIAFESTRDGGRNIFTIDPNGSQLRAVTKTDEVLSLSGFSTTPDGEPAVDFSASLDYDLFRSPRPYFVGLNGGEPTRRHGAFGRACVASPDGKRFLFERGGSDWSRRGYRGSDNCEVWLYDPSIAGDGAFTQLTNGAGNDGWAQWTGDSSFLFLSDRDLATVNVFAQGANPGAIPRRLTGFEGQDVKDLTVSANGRTAFFTVWDKLYRLDLASPGAQPVMLTLTAPDDTFDNEEVKSLASAATEIALNPDGKSVALIAFGDVWVKPVEGKVPARRVTSAIARESEIAWSPDGQSLYFTSDADGGESIMVATVAATREEVAASAKVLEPIPVEAAPEPKAEPIAAPAADPVPAPPAEPVVAGDAQSAEAKEKDSTKDATKDAGKDSGKEKEKEKPKDKPKSERWSEAVRFEVAPFVSEPTHDRMATPSPDGTRLAFRRGRGDIMVMDLATKEVKVIHEGWDPEGEFRWSPDGAWLAFTASDRDYNSDVFIVAADGSVGPVNITRHPDNDTSPRWSADGRILGFLSERTNEESDVWVVALDKSLDGMAKFELEKYFKDATDAAKKRKPLETKAEPDAQAKPAEAKAGEAKPAEAKAAAAAPTLSLGDAYLRVRRVSTMPGNEGNLEISPSGEKLYFNGGDFIEGGLYSISWDGTGQKKLGSRTNINGISLTGDKFAAISGGKGQLMSTSGGDTTSIDIDSSIKIDRGELVAQKFAEAARLMGENFYHNTMKDLDWAALTERYGQLASHARTSSEFDHVANRLLGELNASHLGIRSPSSGGRTVLPQGRIGASVSSTNGGLRIDGLIPESPALTAKVPLMVGDVITAIEFVPIQPGETLSSRMAGTIGKDTVVSVARTLADGRRVEFQTVVLPVTDGAIGSLAYKATQARNAKLVDEWSGGRLGYIHIEGMGQPSLDEFERDLYAACDGKAGLIIDVRNNGGGWTADRLLASICAPVHAYTVPRGGDPKHTDGYPQDRLFIQRFAGPCNMLCNEKSFSNAEIIAHAFKTLRRGTLVGMPTYGGVISTGSASLLDGTTVRMPTRGWFLPDGTDMELHGAQPDIVVPQTPQDESNNNDRQLRAAVDNLMQRTLPSANSGGSAN